MNFFDDASTFPDASAPPTFPYGAGGGGAGGAATSNPNDVDVSAQTPASIYPNIVFNKNGSNETTLNPQQQQQQQQQAYGNNARMQQQQQQYPQFHHMPQHTAYQPQHAHQQKLVLNNAMSAPPPVRSDSNKQFSNKNGNKEKASTSSKNPSILPNPFPPMNSAGDIAISSNQQQQQQQIASNGNTPADFLNSVAGQAALAGFTNAALAGYHQQIQQSALQQQQQQPQVVRSDIHPQIPSAMPKADDVDMKGMSAEEKRRYERNLREQQRSFKISQQIKELRSVLQESNIPFKPNKYSILSSVVDYIKELQTRAVYLDQEHQKLLNTISQTNELVNNCGKSSNENKIKFGVEGNEAGTSPLGNDSELLFVKGLDYKAIFSQCTSALCIASLDGRLLACNRQFENTSGYCKDELQEQTLFNFLTNPSMENLFLEMSKLLKERQGELENGETMAVDEQRVVPFWNGQVHRKGSSSQLVDELYMNITVCESKDGRPQYLNCALTGK